MHAVRFSSSKHCWDKLGDGSYRGLEGGGLRVWSQIVWSSRSSSAGLLHVGLEEHRWRRRAWQVSQTLTGFGEAGRGSSLSEQLLQKISPQFLQWCWRRRQKGVRATISKYCCVGLISHPLSSDLSSWDGELLLTQLAVAGFLVLQPNLTPLKQHDTVNLCSTLTLHYRHYKTAQHPSLSQKLFY